MAFDQLRKATEVGRCRMLVVAPIKPMYSTWPAETQKWDQFKDMTCSILHGPGKDERLFDEADIFLINPEGLKWFFSQRYRPMCQVLCIDESTKFKNSQSVRFKALKANLGAFVYRWILTGTPAPNGLLDLFAQSYIMDEGFNLGRYITHYKKKYFYQTGYGGYTWVPFPESLDEISYRLSDHVLQLNAEDYLDMPELLTIERPVDLPGSLWETVYRPMEKEFIATLNDDDILAPNAAAAGIKLRQIANGAVYGTDKETHVLHDAKLNALDEVVEETNGHPLLVLYEFQHDRDRIMKMLGKEAVCITGMTGDPLQRAVDKFNNGTTKFMVAHAGSLHGMNIQGSCFHMVWYSLPWSLEDYMQAVYRLYRQGQTSKTVFNYVITAGSTVDEKVAEALMDKRITQDRLNAAIATSYNATPT